jgi:hypothetical protein
VALIRTDVSEIRIASQKMTIIKITAVETSNLTHDFFVPLSKSIFGGRRREGIP